MPVQEASNVKPVKYSADTVDQISFISFLLRYGDEPPEKYNFFVFLDRKKLE